MGKVVDVKYILENGKIPEHSVKFMEKLSGGFYIYENGYVFYIGEGVVRGIGYRLGGEWEEAEFLKALDKVVKQYKAYEIFVIVPELSKDFLEKKKARVEDSDVYYVLDVEQKIPHRLENILGELLLEVREEYEFTGAHRRLWAEFASKGQFKQNVRELYGNTEALFDGKNNKDCDIMLLGAYNGENQLIACLLLDFSCKDFVSYIVGAHSKDNYVAHGTDLLFAKMLELGRLRGKQYIHLGLGVNEGITRFKKKWGGVQSLPYHLVYFEEKKEENREIDSLMISFLNSKEPISKYKYMADLPEQKPFAMLWKLTKGDKVSYLGGTAHFFYYSFRSDLLNLYEKVDTVVFEGLLDKASLDTVNQIATHPMPEIPRVIDYLQEKDIQKLELMICGKQSKLKRFFNCEDYYTFDVRGTLQNTYPWNAFFSLWTAFLARNGWKQSVDLEAYELALEMGKKVISMESIREQLDSLESCPMDRIVSFLKKCDLWPQYIKQNIKAYLSGNLEGMMGSSTEFPSRTEQIIDKRDQVFRERMLPYIEKGNAVVFVGSAHVLRLRGMLEADGFKVEQVKPKTFSLFRNTFS